MTDLEKLIKVFDETGVSYFMGNSGEELSRYACCKSPYDTIIQINEGTGYSGFECVLFFWEGTLVGQACLE